MKIAVGGLGYVGLPLAVEFGKKYSTVDVDLAAEKIDAYQDFIDPTAYMAQQTLICNYFSFES